MKLVGGGSVIKGATMSSFNMSQNVGNCCVKIYLKNVFFGAGGEGYFDFVKRLLKPGRESTCMEILHSFYLPL